MEGKCLYISISKNVGNVREKKRSKTKFVNHGKLDYNWSSRKGRMTE
jgi:hypothetical protein